MPGCEPTGNKSVALMRPGGMVRGSGALFGSPPRRTVYGLRSGVAIRTAEAALPADCNETEAGERSRRAIQTPPTARTRIAAAATAHSFLARVPALFAC